MMTIVNQKREFRAKPWRWGGFLVLTISACQAFAADPAMATATPDLTEISLEELTKIKVSTVYGASRHEQKTSEAPSSVSRPTDSR